MWIGADPLTRRALSVSSRSVRGPNGELRGRGHGLQGRHGLCAGARGEGRVRRVGLPRVAHAADGSSSATSRWSLRPGPARVTSRASSRSSSATRSAPAPRLRPARRLPAASEGDMTSCGLSRPRRDRRRRPRGGHSLPPSRPALPSTPTCPDELLASGRRRAHPSGRRQPGLQRRQVLRAGGCVLVCAPARPGRDRAEVATRASGIAPDDLERLFTRFFRVEQARERHIQGTGLGLNIVRSIVEAHGGQVSSPAKWGSAARCP